MLFSLTGHHSQLLVLGPWVGHHSYTLASLLAAYWALFAPLRPCIVEPGEERPSLPSPKPPPALFFSLGAAFARPTASERGLPPPLSHMAPPTFACSLSVAALFLDTHPGLVCLLLICWLVQCRGLEEDGTSFSRQTPLPCLRPPQQVPSNPMWHFLTKIDTKRSHS